MLVGNGGIPWAPHRPITTFSCGIILKVIPTREVIYEATIGFKQL